MTFNLKKQAQKAKDSVLPQSAGLANHVEKYNLSLSKKDYISNFNTLLDEDRRPIESPVTHEAMLDEVRKKAAKSEKIIEGELEDADSPLFPHRQHEDGAPGPSITPANMLTEAFDRKFRDAFAKANNDPDTAFWDKYVGVQLDGNITKVPNNVPNKGSQLQGNPDRFGNLDGLPHQSDAEKNRNSFGKKIEIEPMHGFKGGEKAVSMALASLRDADRILFATYYKASKEARQLNNKELELIAGINRDKKNILLSLAQVPPSAPPSFNSNPNPSVPVEGNIPDADRDTDFLNGNDPTAGDPNLWANMSGFDSSAGENQLPVAEGDISLDSGEPSVPEMGDTLPPLPGGSVEPQGNPNLGGSENPGLGNTGFNPSVPVDGEDNIETPF